MMPGVPPINRSGVVGEGIGGHGRADALGAGITATGGVEVEVVVAPGSIVPDPALTARGRRRDGKE